MVNGKQINSLFERFNIEQHLQSEFLQPNSFLLIN
jgi:hypothetical protein